MILRVSLLGADLRENRKAFEDFQEQSELKEPKGVLVLLRTDSP